jgi:hypothetical protein
MSGDKGDKLVPWQNGEIARELWGEAAHLCRQRYGNPATMRIGKLNSLSRITSALVTSSAIEANKFITNMVLQPKD